MAGNFAKLLDKVTDDLESCHEKIVGLNDEIEKLGDKYEAEMATWISLKKKTDWAKLDERDVEAVRKAMKDLLDKAVKHMDKIAKAQTALAAEGAKLQKYISEMGKVKVEK